VTTIRPSRPLRPSALKSDNLVQEVSDLRQVLLDGMRSTATKGVSMRKFNLMTAATLAAFLLLAGCHTTSGVGKDLSSAGGAITKSADKHSY
jgi:predicted small secreted protein